LQRNQPFGAMRRFGSLLVAEAEPQEFPLYRDEAIEHAGTQQKRDPMESRPFGVFAAFAPP